MTVYDPEKLLEHLCEQSEETEWLEFKVGNFHPENIGEYVSSLANSAIINNQDRGYLIFGVEDGIHEVVGTAVRLQKEKIRNDNFLFWLSKLLFPRINIEFRVYPFKTGYGI